MSALPRPRPPVCRRLVFDDDVTEASIDNFANVLQESLARDKAEKSKKWNFDFDQDKQLANDGKYEWTVGEAPFDWVGKMIASKDSSECTTDTSDDDEIMKQKVKNEETPRSKIGEKASVIRKRKKTDERSGEAKEKGGRRRISFD